MTKAKTPQSSLSPNSLPRKAVRLTAKFAVPIQSQRECRSDDAMIQSTNKRRRYQRRGSKAPGMMLAALKSSPREVDDIGLAEIQRRLLADTEFLRILQQSEAREALVQQRMQRRASLKLPVKSPVALE